MFAWLSREGPRPYRDDKVYERVVTISKKYVAGRCYLVRLYCAQLLAVPEPGYYAAGGGVVQMTVLSNTKDPEARQSPWWGFVKFLLLAILVLLMYLLAESMTAHRFFRGGWVDQHDVLNP